MPRHQRLGSCCNRMVYIHHAMSIHRLSALVNLKKWIGFADRNEWRRKPVVFPGGGVPPVGQMRTVCLPTSRSDLLKVQMSILEDVASRRLRYQ